MAIFTKIITFAKAHLWISGFVVLAVGGSTIFYFTRPAPEPLYDTAPATKRDLQQEVTVTGQVKPAEELNLAFEVSGKVVAVNVHVGDTVQPGQILATLGGSELAAELSSARANVASAQSVAQEYKLALSAEQARLDELKLGTRPEEILISETRVANARRAIEDAKGHLTSVVASGDQLLQNLYLSASDVLNDAFTKGDVAVTQHTDELFSDAYITKDQLVFPVTNPTISALAESSRQDALTALQTYSSRLATLGTSPAAADDLLTDALGYLSVVLQFLNNCNAALNAAVGLESSQLASFKVSVSTARAEVVAASTSINKHSQAISEQRTVNQQNKVTAQNQVHDAESTLALEESELQLKRSGTLPDQIRAQEAKVQQATLVLQTQQTRVWQTSAEVQRINAQLGRYALRAPMRGIVTRQDTNAGEIVGSNVEVITLISPSAYEVSANVPEADISKIAVGDEATLTLDAYGDRVVFMANVVEIDPAQTVIEGVTTYKVTFQFAEKDERVRSGMTANLTIVTDRQEQALSVPYRAIIRRDDGQFVRLLVADAGTDAQPTDVAVQTGITSVDGYVQILSGLQEGDPVVVASRE